MLSAGPSLIIAGLSPSNRGQGGLWVNINVPPAAAWERSTLAELVSSIWLEDFATIFAVPIKHSGRSVLTDRQPARLGWMDGQVWVGMAIQMDLYGAEAEMVNQ